MTSVPAVTAPTRAPVTVACAQLTAGDDMDLNIAAAGDAVRRARDAGARLVLLPENVAMMTLGRDRVLARARREADHPALAAFRDLARECGIWLHAGTLGILREDGRAANRTYVLDPEGAIAARYDKIHMFDVDLSETERYRESETFSPGDRAVTVDLPWLRLGLSVCYDLRFAALYRTLAQAGADALAVPAAFTVPTGRAHWHVLLRARAIETGSYVLAPAQTGAHPQDRRTYGHALIIGPWGEVLADAGETPGLITATLDPAEVDAARAKVPALIHDRPFSRPSPVPAPPSA
ncbi:carbon-nitrogen hydrolase family protein [Roseospira visakhapatnamensis]|uniref:Putative amidohydrolase n=1 Tax=Roseospira visakhapatnamensis TaxID=390880 RepID=A0A7W6RB25_9PROT|nr:putative amidohydrolase [Roseospira visakhapatnamensis]